MAKHSLDCIGGVAKYKGTSWSYTGLQKAGGFVRK